MTLPFKDNYRIITFCFMTNKYLKSGMNWMRENKLKVSPGKLKRLMAFWQFDKGLYMHIQFILIISDLP